MAKKSGGLGQLRFLGMACLLVKFLLEYSIFTTEIFVYILLWDAKSKSEMSFLSWRSDPMSSLLFSIIGIGELLTHRARGVTSHTAPWGSCASSSRTSRRSPTGCGRCCGLRFEAPVKGLSRSLKGSEPSGMPTRGRRKESSSCCRSECRCASSPGICFSCFRDL